MSWWMFGIWLSLAESAWAVGCPWEGQEIETATANTASVTINGTRHRIVGSANKTRFIAILMACGERDAAKEFQTWRSMRMGVTASAVSVFGLIYTPFAAMASAMYRDQMIIALYEEEGGPEE